MTDAIELLEVPTRNLDDDIVQARLETGARHLSHGILDFIERDAETQLCSDESQRVSSRFRGQRGRP